MSRTPQKYTIFSRTFSWVCCLPSNILPSEKKETNQKTTTEKGAHQGSQLALGPVSERTWRVENEYFNIHSEEKKHGYSLAPQRLLK